jgi:DNA-binding winged helix-turn-helix (wHTH) protein
MHQPDSAPLVRPGALAPMADFVLGDWTVQPGLNRLTRHGTAQHVRPQLMDVLVCLADSAGRTVHRDELLRTVWPGQTTVAESAVARCIAELRQVLGDRAAAPTHIETIHKRGYRVIAPVAALAVTFDRPVAPDATLSPAAPPVRLQDGTRPRRPWRVWTRVLVHQLAAAFTLR